MIMTTLEHKPSSAPAPKPASLPDRPGLSAGQSQEFTLISPIKPGGAERIRKLFREGFDAERQKHTDRIGTVHDLRFVIFDNDTRMIFASTFDGTWDSYIDDFGGIIPDEIDLLFHECEGYPGIHDPGIKDWIVKHQVTATAFYSAYPEASVRDIWKALKTKKALDALLDQA
jgi:hypothetical protein